MSPEVFRDAWMLRHAAYASHGFIEATPSGMFMDDCDYFPNTKVVVLYRNNLPIGTVRVCLYAPASGIPGADSIPAMDVFRDEITGLLEATPPTLRGPRAVEVMRLATHPDIGNDREPTMALFMVAGYLTLYFEANAVVCAVRKHHMPFYRRLGFKKVTEPRPYPKLKFETGLMACVQRNTEELKRAAPILHPVSVDDDVYENFIHGEMVPVFAGVRSPEGVSRLLAGRTDWEPATVRPAILPQGRRPLEMGLAA